MNMIKISICSQKLLLLMAALGSMWGCNRDDVVDIPGDYELRRKSGDSLFAIYYSPNTHGFDIWKVKPEKRSEPIFDGSVEPFNNEDLTGTEDMFILKADGKKYLMNGYSGKLMFDGNPYTQYAKDNRGDIYFQTDKGIYHMISGVPNPVELYYWTGGAFIYRIGGGGGAFTRI